MDTNPNILIIDDDQDDITLAKECLFESRVAKFKIQSAGSLTKGVDLIRNHNFDCILLDLGLPESRGIDTLVLFFQHVTEVPVVVMTNNTDDELNRKCINLGAEDFIVKRNLTVEYFSNVILHSIERFRLRKTISEKSIKLIASAESSKKILDNTISGLIILNKEGNILYINPAAKNLLGRSETELINFPFGFAVESDGPTEIDLIPKDKTLKTVELKASSIEWHGEDCILVSMNDITGRKQAEEEIKRVNRLYLVMSSINQAIVHIKDKQKLFDEACRIAVEDGNFIMAWIGIVDSKTQKVNPVSSAGLTDGYLKTINIDLNDKARMQGPTGQAVMSGRHYVANDIANNPEMVPWRESAIMHGYKSSVAFPLTVFGKIIGTFSLYSNEPFFFDKTELKLLDELVLDISFAIESIENEYNHRLAEEEICKLNSTLEIKVNERTAQLELSNIKLRKEIEERKRAEELAHQSEEYRFRQFISSPVGMALCKMDGSLVDINPAYAKILGRTVDETLTLTYWDITPEKYAKQEEAQLQSLETTGTYGPYYKEYIHKDGHLVPVELSGLILELNGEQFIWSTVQDISQRKLAEDEIKKAKTEAERANMAKSEFLSRMSHELRTPMNSILGFAQLMNMGELDPVHKRGVHHILKAGKHLLTLINEVLEISRIEADKSSPSLEPVLLERALEEALDIVMPMAAERNLKLELKYQASNGLYVYADHQKLKQVLLNLINNAIKYNRQEGSVIVDYEITAHPAGKFPVVRINITDTGEGIAPEDIDKLFTPFVRLGKDASEVEGTGLGLSVVKKLVELMNGNTGVESRPGIGSTFWVELPQAEGAIDFINQNGGFTKFGTKQAQKKGTILYIEDNPSNIDLVEQILLTYHPKIFLLTEKYGKEAVKHATDYKPDLILLDLNLPDIHGSKVIKLLQSNPKTKSIPVVVISADAMEKQVEELLKAGAKDYLTKPLDVIQFLQVVDNYMEKNNFMDN